MGAKSKIEWTDATWTPIRARRKNDGKVGIHCEKVSAECKHCYAERMNLRNLPQHGTGLPFTVLSGNAVDIFVDENIAEHPLRWKRPRKIFVCSQTDLFAQFVPDPFIDRLFAIMAICRQHTFQVLTKRPERMLSYMTAPQANQRLAIATMSRSVGFALDNPPPTFPLANVWLGVTAGTQQSADERIPLLLKTPAAKRFLSCEPLLERITLNKNIGGTKWLGGQRGCVITHTGMGTPECPWTPHHHHDDRCGKGLDWVIAGGESGPGARPTHPEWARGLRDQCQAAGAAFHFKQWGEHAPITRTDGIHESPFGGQAMVRIGKQKAGRLLDGREWNEMPE